MSKKYIPQTELDRLLDERIEMQAKIRAVRTEIERRYRDKIDEEVAFETRAIERNFAVQLVEAKERGATYAELVKVLGTGTAAVMRRFIELGGGTVRRHVSSEEKRAERVEESGLKHVSGFEYSYEIEPGVFTRVELKSKNGRVHVMPIGNDVKLFLEKFGTDRTVLYELGEKIVELFGVEAPGEFG